MVLARATTLPKGLARTVLRRAGSNSRSRSWRQLGRRGYASGHEHQEGSEIPWMIGSAAVTIPAVAWMLQQGPKKGDHGHDAHHDKHEEKGGDEKEEAEEPKEESQEEEPQEESTDEAKDESKDNEQKDEKEGDDKDEGSDESAAESSSDDSGDEKGDASKSDAKMSEDGFELPGPNAPKQINWHSGMSKGPGEGQKGERKPTEKKGEKDARGDFSGAKHPYLEDPEKSKKGVGVVETARIHGTVDPGAPARGVKSGGDTS